MLYFYMCIVILHVQCYYAYVHCYITCAMIHVYYYMCNNVILLCLMPNVITLHVQCYHAYVHCYISCALLYYSRCNVIIPCARLFYIMCNVMVIHKQCNITTWGMSITCARLYLCAMLCYCMRCHFITCAVIILCVLWYFSPCAIWLY